MRNSTGYNFLKLFSPLDLATGLYIAVTGIYMCFGNGLIQNVALRLGMLALIVTLTVVHSKFPANRFLLFLRNLYPLLLLGFFYTETSCMKNIVFSNNLDPYFYNAEQALWGCQPSLAFSKIMNQGWFNELMNICYFSYYIMISLVCIVLYLNSPKHSARGIFTVIFSFYLYYLLFALLPVVGPQYYITNLPPETAPPHFFGRLMHHIITGYEQPTGAFPSSHVGIAVVIALISYRHFKKLFFVILPFALGICFATVYIKAHYLIDVVAGLVSAPLFVRLSEKAYAAFLAGNLCKNAEKPIPDPIS